MASDFAIHKVVTVLPAKPEANCLYLVRTGSGFDFYGTNRSGMPVQLNQPQLHHSHWSGRFYNYTDNRWVGWNQNYGPNNQNWNYNLGTNAEPDAQWNQRGIYLLAGAQLRRLCMAGRVNNTQVTGFNFRVLYDTGNWGGGWDSNVETTRTVMFTQDGLTFNASDQTQFSLDLSSSAPLAADGYIKVAYQPTGTITGTRYFYTSLFLEYSTPV